MFMLTSVDSHGYLACFGYVNDNFTEAVASRPNLLSALARTFLTGSFLSVCPAVLGETSRLAASSELEPVIVTGKRSSLNEVVSEADRVGPANQPEWTTRRAFAETDIYVIPPGEIEFNQFYVFSHPRHGKPEHLFESELEVGLPWRTQFDVEINYNANGGNLEHDSVLLELPHALADWGEIPLNPTIDGGWQFNSDEADAYFFRLLLADEFTPRIHFGANLNFANQIGGERERAYELNAALSYVVADLKLTAGVELLVEHETAHEDGEDESSTVVMLGPTVLYKPTRTTHLGFVPLIGLTHDSPIAEAFIIFGVDLEPFAGKASSSEVDGPLPVRRYR